VPNRAKHASRPNRKRIPVAQPTYSRPFCCFRQTESPDDQQIRPSLDHFLEISGIEGVPFLSPPRIDDPLRQDDQVLRVRPSMTIRPNSYDSMCGLLIRPSSPSQGHVIAGGTRSCPSKAGISDW
jgi:hypothetical protein